MPLTSNVALQSMPASVASRSSHMPASPPPRSNARAQATAQGPWAKAVQPSAGELPVRSCQARSVKEGRLWVYGCDDRPCAGGDPSPISASRFVLWAKAIRRPS